MKKLLVVGIAAATFFGTPALAADVPAPVFRAARAEPASGWTGFYLGGNVGYGLASDPSHEIALNGPVNFQSFNLSPRGVLGGGQIGYNWQAAPNWVWGIETDIQASAQTDSTTCISVCSAAIFLRGSQKLPWFGTLRGRFGWTNGPALYYVTGGLAYGEVTTGYTADFLAGGIDQRNFSHTKSGRTVGGGIETQLAGNWTAKVEYLYIDLGKMTDSFIGIGGVSFVDSNSIRNHVVRVGLNYKFGDPIYAPAARTGGIYKAPPAVVTSSWSGFYLGGNVGYGAARDPNRSTETGPLANFSETFNLTPHGVLGGGQIGYNWQAAPNWVWGIEADIQSSAQKDSTTCATFCNAVASTQVSQKLPWFGTLRGRFGWTNGPALYYVTGGLAYGEVTTNYGVNFNGAGFDQHNFRNAKSGRTVGGGIEAQLAGNWTAKVEYLYIDLGNVTDSFIYTPTPAGSYVESSAIRNHVARVGLNYKFGSQ